MAISVGCRPYGLNTPAPILCVFVASAQAGIDDADMIMSVRINGEARAYPIREMGYHHIVNDVVGGEPIVATY